MESLLWEALQGRRRGECLAPFGAEALWLGQSLSADPVEALGEVADLELDRQDIGLARSLSLPSQTSGSGTFPV